MQLPVVGRSQAQQKVQASLSSGRIRGQECLMRINHIVLALALCTSSIAGCVRQGSVPPPNGGHDLITAEELETVRDYTLYDAVLRLRPNFLKSRAVKAYGLPATSPVMVYVDGEKMDSIDDLRRISPNEVLEVRFYEPQIANTRFARYNNSGGAINVIMKVGT
jgi:hypothetical protein